MRKRIGTRDIRPAIAHAEMVDPADYGRFRKLGVIPAMSFQWAKPGPDSIDAQKDYIGPERFSRVEPEGSLYAAKAPIAYGSDWPVDTLNEWFALQVGITRENPAGGKYAGRFNDQKGLPRRFALRSITKNSAHELHQDRPHRLARARQAGGSDRARPQLLRIPKTADHGHQRAADHGGRQDRLRAKQLR